MTGETQTTPLFPHDAPESIEDILPKVELLETDGVPMESAWHRLAMTLLLEVVSFHFRHRDDYFAGGNMFIYYSEEQARTRSYRGPDFFYVNGVPRTPLRRYWVVWQEGGRYPDVIIELLSPSTREEDLTTKRDLYERTFRTHEYFCYDPPTQALMGWRLRNRRYEAIPPNERGWLWCEELQLWLGTWEGAFQGNHATWLRFYDPNGELVMIEGEAERRRAEAQHQRAEAERQRAEAERQRAEALEAELARLRAQLAERGGPPQAGEPPP
jgi:Uma2 family endonuclease